MPLRGNGMEVPKQRRLEEIYRRLAQAPAAATFAEMRAQLADVINAVEDQLTGIPHDPANWRNDGRIYPVADDNVFTVAEHPRVTLLRARKNLIYIGDNGSAEIRNASGDVVFQKAGRDGREVWSWTEARLRRPWPRSPPGARSVAHAHFVVAAMATNDIERLSELLRERFPDGSYSILKPRTETGGWFLDATLNGYDLVIEWRPGRGFGLSTPADDDFGLGPDEVYEDVDSAFQRAKALLLSQTPTRPPTRATLPELREARRLSQAELANRLSINQGACSRMERRSDMLIGTLRNVVAAMGGELYLVARFPGETVYIDLESVETRNGSKPGGTAAA